MRRSEPAGRLRPSAIIAADGSTASIRSANAVILRARAPVPAPASRIVRGATRRRSSILNTASGYGGRRRYALATASSAKMSPRLIRWPPTVRKRCRLARTQGDNHAVSLVPTTGRMAQRSVAAQLFSVVPRRVFLARRDRYHESDRLCAERPAHLPATWRREIQSAGLKTRVSIAGRDLRRLRDADRVEALRRVHELAVGDPVPRELDAASQPARWIRWMKRPII